MSILNELPQNRTLVMGILNVTPDSFSDGGTHNAPAQAVEHAKKMLAEGADIIDIGGESTRPGATPVPVEEEIARVVPVIEELAKIGATMSIDTLHAETAQAALNAGAHIINDVSGERLTDEMIAVAAETGAPYILTHARGNSQTMNSLAAYQNTVEEVIAELQEWTARLTNGGVAREQIILDPGLGFAKLGAQDWELLAGIDRFNLLGYPVLIGASRKRFVGQLLAGENGEAPVPTERDAATAAISALSAYKGAWAVRVHNVKPSADAVAAAHAWRSAEAQ